MIAHNHAGCQGKVWGHLVPENHDLISLVWKAAVPMIKVVKLKASKTHNDWPIRAQGVGFEKTNSQIRKWYGSKYSS